MPAFLNKTERDDLLNEIKDLKMNQIRGRMQRKPGKVRLAFYRNAQHSDQWMTRYILEDLGTQVTVIERPFPKEVKGKPGRDFEIVEIIVEPTAENRL